ncbi:MAG: hydrogenase maturation protease [Hyphomonas sp.]|uniref:hydrogenase maturation protease n=1 Tax=Hyphomonas sp. TaxID=87 RepID=UPI003529A3E9
MTVRSALVLGLGNSLMTDDAAGPLVIEFLQSAGLENVRLCDGGTAGLNLLPEIEACDAIIAVDAARFGASPGTVRTFEGAEMDHQLRGRKSTAHEVALADLMAAAALIDACPEKRALVAVEPAVVRLGLEPTPEVAIGIPRMAEAVVSLLDKWNAEVAAL